MSGSLIRPPTRLENRVVRDAARHRISVSLLGGGGGRRVSHDTQLLATSRRGIRSHLADCGSLEEKTRLEACICQIALTMMTINIIARQLIKIELPATMLLTL